MTTTRFLSALALALFFSLPARAEDGAKTAAPPALDGARLERHVGWMASPERKGRGGWKEREATAAYIAEAFRKAGLQPLPGRDSMDLDTPGVKEPAIRNVAAWLPGAKGAAGEHVILSAHHDHLGQKVIESKGADGAVTRTTRTFHGADDNATGVAALLEIARVLGAQHKGNAAAFPRALVFVAFDLEEQNMLGSTQYVKSPPLPLADCAAFLTMDMLGRSIADLVPGSLFVMGTESCAALDAHVRALAPPEAGRKIIVGIDFQPGYSDYVPFMKAKIPYVFLTSGACADYHRTSDIAARVDRAQLLARTRWVMALALRVVRADARPVWRDGVAPQLQELQTLREVIRSVEGSIATVAGLPPMATMVVKNYGAYLDKVLEDGTVTVEERTSARLGALNLFRIAVQLAGG